MKNILTQIEVVLNNQNNWQYLAATIDKEAAQQPFVSIFEQIVEPISNNKKDLDYVKQSIGRRIKDIMLDMGFVHFKKGKKIKGSSLFNVGSVYTCSKDSNKSHLPDIDVILS